MFGFKDHASVPAWETYMPNWHKSIDKSNIYVYKDIGFVIRWWAGYINIYKTHAENEWNMANS